MVSAGTSFLCCIYLSFTRKWKSNILLLFSVTVSDLLFSLTWFILLRLNRCMSLAVIELFTQTLSLALINCTGLNLLLSLKGMNPLNVGYYFAYSFVVPIIVAVASVATDSYFLFPPPNGCFLKFGYTMFYYAGPVIFSAFINTVLFVMILVELRKRAATVGKFHWSTLHLKHAEKRLLLMQTFYYVYVLGAGLQYAEASGYYAGVVLSASQGLLNSVAIWPSDLPSKLTQHFKEEAPVVRDKRAVSRGVSGTEFFSSARRNTISDLSSSTQGLTLGADL